MRCAQRYYQKRRADSKEPYRLEDDKRLRRYVTDKLKCYWSPEQISGRLQKDYDLHVSPVTIYNENTNGLLRQFFPKGADFKRVSQTELDRVVELLNNRPRKCLNYRTPTEVFWSKPMRCASD